MAALRGRAIHIHDELEYADCSAFYGMLAIWDSKTHFEHTQGKRPFKSETDSVVVVDDEARTVTITGLGYAVGHYARWLNRGAVRVEVTTNDPLVLASAFVDAAARASATAPSTSRRRGRSMAASSPDPLQPGMPKSSRPRPPLVRFRWATARGRFSNRG